MDPALAKEVSVLAQNRAITEAIEKGESEIQKFYKDATILITGGTGFLGKQLIEKLFRSCDIKKVYMLMRPKKKVAFHERLNVVLEDPVFDAVKKLKPDFVNKLQPVQGDVAEPSLGISEQDLAKIVKEVDIIIHGAATVNFDETLKIAACTNVRGTVKMLELARSCTQLKSFVHISTAFAHCTTNRVNDDVLEKFYDAPLSPKLMIQMVETMNEQRLNDITPELIQNWPNTYTFTKAIAEEACREAGAGLPLTIVRPGIVISSYLEPSPGWLDMSCANGPSGLVLGAGLGVLHTLLATPDIKIDVVPVDMVNNAIIAAAWGSAKQRESGDKDVKIFTVNSARNFIKWHALTDTMKEEGRPNYSTPSALYYCFIVETKIKWLFILLSWLWHYIPAYIVDTVRWVLGKPPVAVKLYTKAAKLNNVLSYFTCNEWNCSDKNLQQLYSSLNRADKLIYNFDIATVNWQEQIIMWCLGVRKYIIKDNLQGTETGLRKQFWFRILHYAVVAPLYFYFLYKVVYFALCLPVIVLSYVY